MRHLAIVIVLLAWLDVCVSRPSGIPGWLRDVTSQRLHPMDDDDTDSGSRSDTLSRILSKLELALLRDSAPAQLDSYQYRHYAPENSASDKDSSAGMMINKRKPFWQPMGGPLPVATRFASFGSRIEPDKVPESDKSSLKAMRYGRR